MTKSGPDFNQQATLWNFEHAFGWLTSADAGDGGSGGGEDGEGGGGG
jgi:hypothetical protein